MRGIHSTAVVILFVGAASSSSGQGADIPILDTPRSGNPIERDGNEVPIEKKNRLELERLSDLWDAVIEHSQELKFAAAVLWPHDYPATPKSHTKELLTSILSGEIRYPSRPTDYRSAFGMALTNPNPEPTYPVPGGQAPAYLLPARAAHEVSHLSGASVGSTLLALSRTPRTDRHPKTDVVAYQQLSLAVNRLVAAYRDYITSLAELHRAEEMLSFGRETLKDPGNTNAESLKMQYQQRFSESTVKDRQSTAASTRKKLVEMAGSDAVLRLDTALATTEPSQKK